MKKYVIAVLWVLLGFVGGVWMMWVSDALPRIVEGSQEASDVGPPVVKFDLYRNHPGGPSPAKFVVTAVLRASPPKHLAVAVEGESRWNWIVCNDGEGMNPCGPEGLVPDEFGALTIEARREDGDEVEKEAASTEGVEGSGQPGDGAP